MMSIDILVADDEPAQRTHLCHQLRNIWPGVTTHEAEDGFQVLELTQQHTIKVAFLDIRMPGVSGLELARQLSNQLHIVFVTAYDEYAVSAFDANAIDYLLKPIEPNRLNQTLSRVRQRLNSPPVKLEQFMTHFTPANKTAALSWIQASSGNTIHFLSVEDVFYFQSDTKYTRVVTAKQELLIRKSIRQLQDELNTDRFWQIHRSTLVAVNRIEFVKRESDGSMSLKIRDRDVLLPVSQGFQYRFRQM